jgi:hypothetical protein
MPKSIIDIIKQKENTMKNKMIIFTSIALASANLQADRMNPADRLIAFKTMEKGHKDDWFNYMKQVHNEKYNLLKKIHGDWVNFGTQAIRTDYSLSDCSPASKDALYAARLKEAVNLHVSHNAKFKALCQSQHDKALEIAARHEQDLAPYIAMANQA